MILPAVLYRVPDVLFGQIMERFQPISDELGTYLRIEMRTDRYQDAIRAIAACGGIMLLITCIDDLQSDDGRRALQLGRLAIQQNRDHYVIYSASDNKTMLQIAPYCSRPAAIVTNALLNAQGPRLIKDIFTDYNALNAAENDSPYINIKEKNTLQRVALNEICAITSANKMVEVHTLKEMITTYDSLESFSKRLDDRFCRCHRSSIINTSLIRNVDFQAMTIVMVNGLEIPLARSFRQSFHSLMAQQKGSPKEGEA